jgi:hypothetical protein
VTDDTTRHSQASVPGRTNIIGNPDLVRQLSERRKYHGDIATEELKKDPPNYDVVNPNQALATLYHDAVTTLEKLIQQNALLTEALKNRVIVALVDAKAPAWVPTHRHYKGTLYRVTGIRYDAEHEELVEKVEYDDEHGNRFILSKRRFESALDSGKQRYEYLYGPCGAPQKKGPTIAEIEAAAKKRVKQTGMDRDAAKDEAARDAGFSSFEVARLTLDGP